MPINWRLFAWCGTGGTTTYIIDLGDVSIHQEESGHISSPGDMLTGRSLGLLGIVDRDEGGGIGGGGDVCCPLLEKVSQFITTRPVMDLCLAA